MFRRTLKFQLSLTSEILISLLLLMIVTTSLIGVISLGILEATAKEEIPSRADIIAETISKTLNRLTRQENFSITSITPEIGYYTNVQGVAVVDKNLSNLPGIHDIMLEDEFNFAGESLRDKKSVKKLIKGFIHYYIPVIKNNSTLGVVRIKIEQDKTEIRKTIYRKLLIMYIVLGSVLILFLGIFILRRRIVSPLQALIIHTKKIAEGNLTERIIPSGGKELIELGDAFNVMAQGLEAKQKELSGKIEELERMNKELIRTRNELMQAEKLAIVGRMASGIAHELGNPISAISGNIELLEKRVRDAKDAEIISRMKNDIERMDRIIRELLDFARPRKTVLQKTDLKKSIEDAIEIIKSQKGFENIQIEVTPAHEVHEIMADVNQLKQVWINLLINSRDAMPDGGRINISIRKDGSNVLVEFSDTGAGIDRESIDKIFEPFFTTKEPGKGTGLGLTVVQRIIQSINGRITVESEPGRGTKFNIIFPG
jgi:signal transduction histidine kinase